MNSSLSKAWNTWYDMAARQADAHSKATTTLARVMSRALVSAIGEWRAVGEEQRRMRKFGTRMTKHNQGRAWESWMDFLLARARMAKFGRRMLNRQAVAALVTWEQYAEQAARLRRLFLKAMNASISRAFNA